MRTRALFTKICVVSPTPTPSTLLGLNVFVFLIILRRKEGLLQIPAHPSSEDIFSWHLSPEIGIVSSNLYSPSLSCSFILYLSRRTVSLPLSLYLFLNRYPTYFTCFLHTSISLTLSPFIFLYIIIFADFFS